jgi:hypothetical protein
MSQCPFHVTKVNLGREVENGLQSGPRLTKTLACAELLVCVIQVDERGAAFVPLT